MSKDVSGMDETINDLKLLGVFVFLLISAIFFIFALPADGPANYQSIVVMMGILATVSVFGIGRQLLSLFFLRRHRERKNRNDVDLTDEEYRKPEKESMIEKLQELLHQKKQLTEAQFLSERESSSSTTEQKEAIAAALEMVSDELDKIKMQIAINKYDGWEKSSLDVYLNISGVDYTKGIQHDINIAREGILFIVEEGKNFKQEFGEFQAESDYVEIAAVIPRIEQIIAVFEDLLQSVNDSYSQGKVLRALKDVNRIPTAADVPLQLLESGFAESVRILQEIKAKPLELEIDFQSERIKALREIVRKDSKV